MPDLGAIRENLRSSREDLLNSAKPLSEESWKDRPKTGAWSAAEIFAHLILVERTILGAASRLIKELPKPISFWERFHKPLWFVTLRLKRVESPIPLDAALVLEKQAAIGQLQDSRENTLTFLEETSGTDYSAYGWRHPFLGRLNFYEWFHLLGNHEERHSKQIQEIVEIFQKQK